jgi:uncharacterized membrane protein
MESRAKLLGHSVHQMLIVFPLGLLATAVVFDLIYLATGDAMMSAVAYWMVAAGIIGALVAAPFGTIDWLAIQRGTRAKKIGAVHGLGNIGSWLLRGDADTAPPALAYVLSFAGAALALFTGWLGGELVARLGVGVYERANLDAPTSLHGEPAHERVVTH